MRVAKTAVLWLGISWFFLGLSAEGSFATENQKIRPHVLLITIDTLRADYLSCYGFSEKTTPAIDRMAQKGARFSMCRTPIPLTDPAHASLMTSLYPQAHGIVRNGLKLSSSVRTLAQVLKAQGYETAAFVSGWTLRKSLVRLDRGFDHYDDAMTKRYDVINSERFADQTYQRAVAWLNARDPRNTKPFFLWVHFFDPHAPYREHPQFEELPTFHAKGHRNAPLRKASRYAQEVAFADMYAGRLMHWFEERNLTEKTLMVLTADHGESLGEHGYTGHGRQVYEPVMRIPLVVRYDAHIPQGKVVDFPVHLLDVAPTVLECLGLAKPPAFQGMSLTKTMESTQAVMPEPRTLYFETYPGTVGHVPRILRWLFVRKHSPLPVKIGELKFPYKVIYTPDLDRLEVYRLTDDAGETANLSDSLPHRDAYGESLVRWFHTINSASPSSSHLTHEDKEKLRSLGYLE